MPRRSHHPTRLAVAVTFSTLLASCADKPNPSPSGSDSPTPPTTNTAAPIDSAALLPERLRIHPLTRFLREESGRLDLIVHLELRDHFGQAVKGLGLARIELYRPSGIAGSGAQTQEAVWEVDLRTPDANAEAYDDLITRTYTLLLTDLPESVDHWVGQSGAEASAAPGGLDWLLIKAYFTFRDSAGQDHHLEATYRMSR
jgi:hypothetical protein